MQLFAEKGSSQVSMSDLAAAAGVARGTVHNNLTSPEAFFQQIAHELADDMHARVMATAGLIADPVVRLSLGIRFYIRRAHEEPHWGRFMVRFAMSEQSLQSLWRGQPTQDLATAHAAGRFNFRQEQLPFVIGFIASVALGGILMVLEGHRTWRQAGSDAAEFVFKALGMAPDEARSLAEIELPPLVSPATAPPKPRAPSSQTRQVVGKRPKRP